MFKLLPAIFKLILVIIYFQNVLAANDNKGITKLEPVPKKTECETFYFKCENGECIEGDYVCDGKVHCKDGSDETVAECLPQQCPSYAFRCAYGACIPATMRCDGSIDCVDKSDENELMCNDDTDNIVQNIQGDCVDEFNYKCLSGECIPLENICDGEGNCKDASDETVELCAFIQCPAYAYRCGYGGCISKNAVCNNFADCYDKSDELHKICMPSTNTTDDPYGTQTTPIWPVATRVPPLHDCVIPEEKKYMVVKDYMSGKRYAPGDTVTSKTLVTVHCKGNRKLTGKQFSACFDGKWIAQLPECAPVCSRRKGVRGVSTTPSCSLLNKHVNCKRQVHVGTKVKFSCAPFYRLPSNVTNQTNTEITCDADGEWSEPKLKCVPDCGIVERAHLESATKPWDVSIFQRSLKPEFNYVCPGAIVSEKIVIAAGSCFSKSEYSYGNDATLYNVIEGVYDVSYTQGDNIGYQMHNISQIVSPTLTDDINDTEFQIGLLIIVNYFKFTPILKPICLTAKTDAERITLQKYSLKPRTLITKKELIDNIQRTYLVQIVVETANGNLLNIGHYFEQIQNEIQRYNDLL